jgi:hypothetical protein
VEGNKRDSCADGRMKGPQIKAVYQQLKDTAWL